MSLARRLIPGQVHATSRRVARRALFLPPRAEVGGIVAYGAGHALQQAPRLRVLAFMQNTNHLDVTRSLIRSARGAWSG